MISTALNKKLLLSKKIISNTLKDYKGKNIAVAWTGGKDSTLLLWLIRQAVSKDRLLMPKIIFIDEGNTFTEIKKFIKYLSKKWRLKIITVRNVNILKQVSKIGESIKVVKLDRFNRNEINRIGYRKKSLPFDPDSFVGSHLMKTVPLNQFITTYQIEALFTGIRWDEQKARSHEKYISIRGDSHTSAHVRVHPLLHMKEKDVWQTIHQHKIPFCPLYKKGYRSLGVASSTRKYSSQPAWEQDNRRFPERAGRNKEKEKMMRTLRDLGYM